MNTLTRPPNMTMSARLLLAGLAVYWLLVLPLPLANIGGRGTQLPLNSLAWAYMLLLMALVWLLSPASSCRARFPVRTLLLGAALMSLPLLWSPSPQMQLNGLPAIAGLWGGCLFFITLLRAPFPAKARQLLLCCIAAAGVVQGMLVLTELYVQPAWLPHVWQTFIEKYGRSGVGVFQQVNVTSSFLALALTVAMLQFVDREAAIAQPQLEKARRTLMAGAIPLLTMILVLLYSRTGWLSAAVVAAGMLYLTLRSPFRQQARHGKWLCLLLIVGVIAGLLMLNMSVTQALELHEGSNLQRVLTLQQSLILSLYHPVIGHGAGSYEGIYQSWLAALPGGNPGKEVMAHPHNELLYQFFEGGVIALAGIGLLYWLWVRQLFSVTHLQQAGAALAMAPVLLHTQLEYPLYYSVPHWLTLLLLLRLSLREEDVTEAKPVALLARGAIASVALYGAVVAALTLHANQVMDLLEEQKLTAPGVIADVIAPWPARLRYEHNLDLLTLMQFPQTRNRKALETFSQTNALWLSVHADADMYQNQIAVLTFLKRDDQARAWKEKARRTFPWDERFR